MNLLFCICFSLIALVASKSQEEDSSFSDDISECPLELGNGLKNAYEKCALTSDEEFGQLNVCRMKFMLKQNITDYNTAYEKCQQALSNGMDKEAKTGYLLSCVEQEMEELCNWDDSFYESDSRSDSKKTKRSATENVNEEGEDYSDDYSDYSDYSDDSDSDEDSDEDSTLDPSKLTHKAA